MNPCPRKFMPSTAWRRFLAAHPLWIAPIVAPCAAGAALTGWGVVRIFQRMPEWLPEWHNPPAVNPWIHHGRDWCDYAGTPVPEPSSLACMIVVIGVVLLAMWWAR